MQKYKFCALGILDKFFPCDKLFKYHMMLGHKAPLPQHHHI